LQQFIQLIKLANQTPPRFCVMNKNSYFLKIFSKKYGSKDFIRISNILDLQRLEYRENNEFIWQYFYINLTKIMPKIDEIIAKINSKSS